MLTSNPPLADEKEKFPSTEALSNSESEIKSPNVQSIPWSQMLRVEWLGQTLASLCWIASVFSYGISSVGDWLQLAAASAWLVANFASLLPGNND